MKKKNYLPNRWRAFGISRNLFFFFFCPNLYRRNLIRGIIELNLVLVSYLFVSRLDSLMDFRKQLGLLSAKCWSLCKASVAIWHIRAKGYRGILKNVNKNSAVVVKWSLSRQNLFNCRVVWINANFGSWWWSSGQHVRLLLRHSEFRSCWSPQFLWKIVAEKN